MLQEDATNRETARKRINNWTAKKTNDKIKDLLDVSALDSDTKLVLVNAVYFLAQWNKTFNEKSTKKDIFNTVDGKTEKELTDSFLADAEKRVKIIAESPYILGENLVNS